MGRRTYTPEQIIKKHESGMKLANLACKFLNTLLGIVNLPLLARGAGSDIQPCLGNVDANERVSLSHYNLLEYIVTALPCTIRAWLALTTVRAFFLKGVATLALVRSHYDPG